MIRILCAATLAALSFAALPAQAGVAKTRLALSTDAGMAMRFSTATLKAKAGVVTITLTNRSPLPHNVAVKGKGVSTLGKIVTRGHVSTVTVTLKRGTYVFYCSVPGHEQAGMKGTLTVS